MEDRVNQDERHPHHRFGRRVENYRRYRPAYPQAVLSLLETEIGLTPQATIADVGAGTGIFSRLLLDYGCTVYGVEPNDEMRAAAAEDLAAYARFHPVAGSAAATGLPPGGVDHITAAQALHWFEPEGTREEFERILRPRGAVVAVYNTWRGEDDPLLAAYDTLMQRYDVEQGASMATPVSVPQRLDTLFGAGGYRKATLPNLYHYDWETFHGGALSHSYAPLPDSPAYESFLAELRALFNNFAHDGVVRFPFTTRVAWGRPFAGRLPAK